MLPIYLTIRYSILFYIFSIFNVKFSLKMHQNHIYQSNNFEMDFQTLFCILSRFCKNLLNYLVVSVKPENISSTYTWGVFSLCNVRLSSLAKSFAPSRIRPDTVLFNKIYYETIYSAQF